MGFKDVDACEVSCQRCEATILVKKWSDARDHGWVVPCDGLLQLCPKCVVVHKAQLSAVAVPIGSLADKFPNGLDKLERDT